MPRLSLKLCVISFLLSVQDVGVATAAASPTQCYLDYVTLPNDNSTLLDLKQAVAILLSHLDRIAAPYYNMSMEEDTEDVRNAMCDWVCDNQPCPHKIHLVGYSSISFVLKQIISFCKLHKILHEFLYMQNNFYYDS